jgi:hypothetical protein
MLCIYQSPNCGEPARVTKLADGRPITRFV